MFGSLGAYEVFLVFLIFFIVIVPVVRSLFRRSASKFAVAMGPALVLINFRVNENPESEEILTITGRKGGLISFLLSAMGLDNKTHLAVTDKTVFYKSTSLSGENNDFASLHNIASAHASFVKPVWMLFLAAFLFIGGLYFGSSMYSGGGLVVALSFIVSLIIIVGYVLKKEIAIILVPNNGIPLGMKFKPSVIHGQKVDSTRAMEALKIVNQAIRSTFQTGT